MNIRSWGIGGTDVKQHQSVMCDWEYKEKGGWKNKETFLNATK